MQQRLPAGREARMLVFMIATLTPRPVVPSGFCKPYVPNVVI